MDPTFWYIGGSVAATAAALGSATVAIALYHWVRKRSTPPLEREFPPPPVFFSPRVEPRAPIQAPKPKDVGAELERLREKYKHPLWEQVTQSIRLTKKRVFLGTRKTGERFLGVLQEEAQVPSDSVDSRPMRDMSELNQIMPDEWAMDEDVFMARLASGEMLVQVPVRNIQMMEDVHEALYKDIVHTVYVLLDVSPSMYEATWRPPVWKALTIKVLLDALRMEATFTIRAFDQSIAPAITAVSPEQVMNLAHRLEQVSSGSGTNILNALKVAMGDFAKMEYDTADLLILTDGEDAQQMAATMRPLLEKHRVKLHAVMIGLDNKALQAACDTYQILENTPEGLKLHPVVERQVPV